MGEPKRPRMRGSEAFVEEVVHAVMQASAHARKRMQRPQALLFEDAESTNAARGAEHGAEDYLGRKVRAPNRLSP